MTDMSPIAIAAAVAAGGGVFLTTMLLGNIPAGITGVARVFRTVAATSPFALSFSVGAAVMAYEDRDRRRRIDRMMYGDGVDEHAYKHADVYREYKDKVNLASPFINPPPPSHIWQSTWWTGRDPRSTG